MKNKRSFIISVGGSLIVPPGGIDWRFLVRLRRLITGRIGKGDRFFLISGGGATCRNYIDAAKKVIKISSEDLDWLGIHATRLNAHLLRTIFFDIAHPEVIKNPTIRISTDRKLVIAGGWKPGWSTDYVAAMVAAEYEVPVVINLSNIDHAYDKDPKAHKDAKPIKEIGWKEFRKIVGNRWIPGMNAPFDPIASRKAQELGLEVIIMKGKDLANLKKCLEGKPFIGTVIK